MEKPALANKNEIPRIDGWPVLGTGYQSGWIHRCYYAHAEEALIDARLASSLVPSKRLYVYPFGPVNRSIDLNLWPEGRYWAIFESPPFHGVCGAYYYPLPDYYIVLGGDEFLQEGDSPEWAEKKKQRTREQWESQRHRVETAVQMTGGSGIME